MSPSTQLIRIATRRSKLALTQTGHVAEHIRGLGANSVANSNTSIQTALVELTTRGDQIQDRPLSQVGGKGLFIKELERALLADEADIAIHSAKDVPMFISDDFTLLFLHPRAEPRDAFVSTRYTSPDQLPQGAKVGTSSLRRAVQLRAKFPKLDIHPLRGNVDTRLAKLDAGEFDAIVLAAAGLNRLGLNHRITTLIPIESALPAITQGVLAVEFLRRRDDLAKLLAPLTHPDLTACALAERAVGEALQGSCEIPIAAHAAIADGTLTLRAMVATPDGSVIVEDHIQGDAITATTIGQQLGERMLLRGGPALLHALALSAKDEIDHA